VTVSIRGQLFVPCLYPHFATTASAPDLPFGTTLVRPAPYAALNELIAVKAHWLPGLALHPTVVEPDRFWTETLETSDSYQAAQLSQADLTTLNQQYNTLAALSENTPKPPELLSYVPTVDCDGYCRTAEVAVLETGTPLVGQLTRP
jgi:hypothetical protein